MLAKNTLTFNRSIIKYYWIIFVCTCFLYKYLLATGYGCSFNVLYRFKQTMPREIQPLDFFLQTTSSGPIVHRYSRFNSFLSIVLWKYSKKCNLSGVLYTVELQLGTVSYTALIITLKLRGVSFTAESIRRTPNLLKSCISCYLIHTVLMCTSGLFFERLLL